MNKIILSILCCISLLAVAAPKKSVMQGPDPLVAVLIMVKNEGTVIRATLEPLIKAGVKHFMILDTGSTDNTIAEVKKTYVDHGIKYGYVIEQPFVDFATSRNYGLEVAEKLFPKAGLFFMIDAEWYLQRPDTFLPICTKLYESPYDNFMISIDVGGSEHIAQNRLFKADRKARFKGAVHEYLAIESISVAVPIVVKYSPQRVGQAKSKERLKRDMEILYAEHEKEPDVARHVYFIAQTYHSTGDLENAAQWYTKASQMKGWDEMLFIAKYRAGLCYENMGDWPRAHEAYLEAYAMRPTRIEPLICLAIHYWNNNDAELAYSFASQTMDIEYPTRDACFVNKKMYELTRYDVLARAALITKHYDVGVAAIQKGLKNNPPTNTFKLLMKLYEEEGITVPENS